VEKAIAKLAGIKQVSVNCITNKARVVLLAEKEDNSLVKLIVQTVQRMGYGCELEKKDDNDRINKNDEEMVTLSWLLGISLFLGLPIMALHFAMSTSYNWKMFLMDPVACHGGITLGQILMVSLNIPLLFGVGYKYYRSAFLGALHGSFGMDFLVMTGTSITFLYNIMTLSFACQSGIPTQHVFLESSGMLLMFVTVGKFIEAYAKGKSASAITSLLKLQPKQVFAYYLPEIFCFYNF
jgi:Cu+-exporting ATPase